MSDNSTDSEGARPKRWAKETGDSLRDNSAGNRKESVEHTPETRRLLSSSPEDSPPPFSTAVSSPPIAGRRGKLRRFPSPMTVFRSPSPKVYNNLQRSLSEDVVHVEDEVFSSYIPTSTRSMVLPPQQVAYNNGKIIFKYFIFIKVK